ncbi:type II toxin-antitoxin system YoeB family toxin [Patescibacteria group bacterium]|nr:type II toxin-antitoxin system YoeB family toxin [Patescibacteria group bacterium]
MFRSNPFDPILKTHKLRGKFSYFWAFSITHSHRVMFEFRENGVAVFIDIGDHSIYE